jgi:hypothetical protein
MMEFSKPGRPSTFPIVVSATFVLAEIDVVLRKTGTTHHGQTQRDSRLKNDVFWLHDWPFIDEFTPCPSG